VVGNAREESRVDVDRSAERFAAVLLDMYMCLEIFGLIRRSALERTSVQPSMSVGTKSCWRSSA